METGFTKRICLYNGIENDIPWMDDLFLEIVLLPSREIIVKDENELADALSNGIFDKQLYDLAWNEVKNLRSLIDKENF